MQTYFNIKSPNLDGARKSASACGRERNVWFRILKKTSISSVDLMDLLSGDAFEGCRCKRNSVHKFYRGNIRALYVHGARDLEDRGAAKRLQPPYHREHTMHMSNLIACHVGLVWT